jgi:hypothetical protein
VSGPSEALQYNREKARVTEKAGEQSQQEVARGLGGGDGGPRGGASGRGEAQLGLPGTGSLPCHPGCGFLVRNHQLGLSALSLSFLMPLRTSLTLTVGYVSGSLTSFLLAIPDFLGV